MTDQPEQLQLPLEWPTYDHYSIKLAKGAVGNMQVIRTHTANSADDAINLIDGLYELTRNRDNVQWQAAEVDERGVMFGLSQPGGEVWEISVTPPLNTPLS